LGKEEIMENRRTESAREHDDSELIESIEETGPAPRFEGRSGGVLQDDIATKAELERVRDPEAREGADKKDDIEHGEASPARRPADKTP
jgi:hypothetical protein